MIAKKIVLAGACRTAIGSMGGALSTTPAPELGSIVIKEALNRAGVAPEQVDHVYMGCVIQAGLRDPNPKVAGKGAKILRDAGVAVVEDFMKDKCDELNPIFFHYITTKTPYVVMKYAMTLDGKIATKTGASKWITQEAARREVQYMRHRYMGIMVGIGTVLADDPMLNVRVEGLKSPVRIICDSKLRIPLDSQIVKSAREYWTIVAYADLENVEKKKEILQTMGVETVFCPDMKKHVNLKHLMEYLGKENIDSILLEGGDRKSVV